jgi:hypothetical protein
MSNMKKYLAASLVITLLAGASYYLYTKYTSYKNTAEVHVHAGFLIIVNDTALDLTAEKYQSSAERVNHADVHLHDGDDNVVHRHADGITFAEFLASLGFTLTNECLTDDAGISYCSDGNNILSLYVNGTPKTVLTEYIPQEEDRVLLYYGSRSNQKLSDYLNNVTDEACIYSGTCPERGVAPKESCGLTCDISSSHSTMTLKEIVTYIFTGHY